MILVLRKQAEQPADESEFVEKVVQTDTQPVDPRARMQKRLSQIYL